MIKVGSDFSGVGAFNQALKRLGIEYKEIFACDMDKYARQTFIHNYGEPEYYPTNVYDRAIPTEPLDIYMTSPPCQAFSLAGKRLGKEDKRGILFFNSYEFIQTNKPRYFIFENVKGLLSDDGGKTFSEWVNMLGGKSVNGNPVIFPYEESVPYHIYWKVLNAKDYGVPQNRERVFIIGIRDDEDNNFNFPKEEYLTKRLKDVLEDEVLSKFTLSEDAINKCLKSQANKDLLIKEVSDVSKCICAGYYKIPFDGQYIKVESNLEKYFLSEKMINGFIKHNEHHNNKCTGFIFEPKDENQIANCLRENAALCQTDNTVVKQDIITHEIPEIVRVRKYEVDIPKLQECLKNHKQKSIKQITKELNVNKTTVEHWFRTDKYFSIPDAEIWFELKKCLNIETDEFDLSITEFIEKEGVFEKSNRVYDENGIAPTMTSTSADEKILTKSAEIKPLFHYGNGKSNERMVYDKDGISPCITSAMGMGGGFTPAIIENNENKEINDNNNDNVKTNDNNSDEKIIINDKDSTTNVIGNLSGGKWDKIHESARRIYDTESYAPAIHTMQGGNLHPKILQVNESKESNGNQPYQHNRVYDSKGIMTTLDTDSGRKSVLIYNDKRLNATIEKNNLPTGEPKAIDTYNQKVQDNAPTLTEPHHNTTRLWDGYKIRRLTPRECFRLMDFPDTFDFSIVSDSQAYKQAGNSIVVSVLAKIISKLKL